MKNTNHEKININDKLDFIEIKTSSVQTTPVRKYKYISHRPGENIYNSFI